MSFKIQEKAVSRTSFPQILMNLIPQASECCIKLKSVYLFIYLFIYLFRGWDNKNNGATLLFYCANIVAPFWGITT